MVSADKGLSHSKNLMRDRLQAEHGDFLKFMSKSSKDFARESMLILLLLLAMHQTP